MSDLRYEYRRCEKCGNVYQNIDFGSAAHVYFCETNAKRKRAEEADQRDLNPAEFEPRF
jgi:hypothetical protein